MQNPLQKLPALAIAGLSFSAAGKASAAVTVFGSTTAYQEVGNDWLSMGTNDIDGDGGLGTDGFIMAGLYDGTTSNNDGTFTTTPSLPSYVSNVVAGSSVIGTTYGNSTYGSIDDPLTLDGADQLAGFWISVGGGAGAVNEAVNFDVGGLTAGQIVRVGIFAGMQPAGDGRWDPTSITLSDGAGSSATVGDHATSQLVSNPGGSDTGNGWVFFDIDTAGTYTVTGTKRLNGQGAGISGITFDSVPEPSTSFLALFSVAGLLLRRRRS